MNPSSRNLIQLQQWMQEAILSEGAAGIENELNPSSRQSAEERLSVYQYAYYARLIESLGEEFAGVKGCVGEEAFIQLCMNYLRAYSPTSYTLADLGKQFPEYLGNSRPLRESEAPDWGDFLIDLASLERTYAEVFDGPGSESVKRDLELDAQQNPLVGTRIVLCPSVRLLELRFPAHQYLSKLRRDEVPVIPPVQLTRLLIFRNGYVVRSEEIDQDQQRILQALRKGVALEHALSQVDDAESDSTLEYRVSAWFESWTRSGIILSMDSNRS